jgi:hypothetical protein
MKILVHSLLGVLVVASASVTAGAQASAHQHAAPKADSSLHAGMATSAHMRHTDPRPATPADSARARAIVDTLRQAIAKYADTSAAVAAGYRMFSPPLRFRPVYHFTSRNNAVANESSFDPSRPTSLLYERAPDGRLELVGAMYTAPRRATAEDLNARVPLGIAPWHLHVNICEPPPSAPERRRETRNGRMLFGPAGVLATKAECDSAHGVFRTEDFNWMIHVDTRHGSDLAAAFADHK